MPLSNNCSETACEIPSVIASLIHRFRTKDPIPPCEREKSRIDLSSRFWWRTQNITHGINEETCNGTDDEQLSISRGLKMSGSSEQRNFYDLEKVSILSNIEAENQSIKSENVNANFLKVMRNGILCTEAYCTNFLPEKNELLSLENKTIKMIDLSTTGDATKKNKTLLDTDASGSHSKIQRGFSVPASESTPDNIIPFDCKENLNTKFIGFDFVDYKPQCRTNLDSRAEVVLQQVQKIKCSLIPQDMKLNQVIKSDTYRDVVPGKFCTTNHSMRRKNSEIEDPEETIRRLREQLGVPRRSCLTDLVDSIESKRSNHHEENIENGSSSVGNILDCQGHSPKVVSLPKSCPNRESSYLEESQDLNKYPRKNCTTGLDSKKNALNTRKDAKISNCQIYAENDIDNDNSTELPDQYMNDTKSYFHNSESSHERIIDYFHKNKCRNSIDDIKHRHDYIGDPEGLEDSSALKYFESISCSQDKCEKEVANYMPDPIKLISTGVVECKPHLNTLMYSDEHFNEILNCHDYDDDPVVSLLRKRLIQVENVFK